VSEALPGDNGSLSLSALERVEQVCTRFDDAWLAGQRPRIEDFLGNTAEAASRRRVMSDMISKCKRYRPHEEVNKAAGGLASTSSPGGLQSLHDVSFLAARSIKDHIDAGTGQTNCHSRGFFTPDRPSLTVELGTERPQIQGVWGWVCAVVSPCRSDCGAIREPGEDWPSNN
jgi:hypothetical protein